MGCASGLLKIILFIVNFVLFLVGGLMLGVGIWLLVADPLADAEGIIEDGSVFDVIVWTLVVLGAIIFIAGFMGCCGACKEDRCMLCTFTIFMTILITLEIVAASFVGAKLSEIKGGLEEKMIEQIQNNYVNETSDDDYSNVWNTLQIEYECCGANSYLDYNNSTYSQSTGQQMPYTCCVYDDVNDPLPSNETLCRIEASTGPDPQCDGGNPGSGNWDNLNPCGCLNRVYGQLDTYTGGFLGIVLGMAAVQGALIVLTCCLRSSIKVHPI